MNAEINALSGYIRVMNNGEMQSRDLTERPPGGHVCTDDDDGLKNLECKSMGTVFLSCSDVLRFVYGSHSRSIVKLLITKCLIP